MPIPLREPPAPGQPGSRPAPSLFPFQSAGVRALYHRDSMLLADDMGLGKTVQACVALRMLVTAGLVETALIVTKVSLLRQWRRELRRFAPELYVSVVHGPAEDRAWQWEAPAHAFITTYETLRSDFTTNPMHRIGRAWGLVILDEAQAIKNRERLTSEVCKQLRRRRAWALTGTPLENDVDDLASVLEFVRPLLPGEPMPDLRPGDEMVRQQREVQLRRRKADVLPDLPPKIVTTIPVELGIVQRWAYERAERDGVLELRQLGKELRIGHVFELIMRLKQICNFCPVSGASAKLEDLAERAATLVAEGHKAVVFSQFTDKRFGCAALSDGLAELNPLVYTGAMDGPERDRVIRQFVADPTRSLLIVSLRAGGLGLNLQEASYVFHFDRWWNPAVEHQAEDRAHRVGQTLPVHIYRYTCERTIEERIEEILQQKQALFDEYVDDVTLDLSRALTREELFGLFGLRAP